MGERPDNFFRELAGVPTHYDRFPEPQFSYGTRGKPLKFHCTEAFEQQLHACFEELWSVCPLGRAEVIASAGAFVDKPGQHGLGHAFDLDCIFWADKTFITLQFELDRAFYLAVESVLRKHFGTVLNFHFNAAHRDHLHVDTGAPTGFFAGHRSRVLYLQMILTHLFGHPVAIDGAAGPQTNGAARELLVQLGLAQPQQIQTDAALHDKLHEVWMPLLDAAVQTGFAGVAFGVVDRTPLELLENVYDVVERGLGGHAARKQIETALTAFANHDATIAFLNQFR
jgi:hypothetical protein